MKQRQAVTAVTVQRYRNGSKKIKQQILDEFCETRGYCRGYCALCLAQSRTTGMAAEKEWSWETCAGGSSGRSPGII